MNYACYRVAINIIVYKNDYDLELYCVLEQASSFSGFQRQRNHIRYWLEKKKSISIYRHEFHVVANNQF
jgi:phosphorylcholine metabolism protein LicD